jgi:hypothetical protein
MLHFSKLSAAGLKPYTKSSSQKHGGEKIGGGHVVCHGSFASGQNTPNSCQLTFD